MFGTAEPSLHLPGDEWLRFAAHARQNIRASRIRERVEQLPAPRNRQHAPEQMMQADAMLIEALRDAGWTADRQPFELHDADGRLDFGTGRYAAGSKPVRYKRLVGANVVGLKHGTSSRDVILVGAHHDTIRDSPGADDNTGSVAALLELARVLGAYDFRDTVVLAALDMEEIGMFGSRELVRLITESRRIRSAIVFETMGYTAREPHTQSVPPGLGWFYPDQTGKLRARRFRGDWTAVLYRQAAVDLARTFGGALAHAAGDGAAILFRDPSDLPVVGALSRALPLAAQFARSDHLSFWRAGIPAILVTDTANFRNPHYHQPSDTPDTLDYERLAAIVAATAVTVATMAGGSPGAAHVSSTSVT